jgi:hypothetical protein
MKLYRLVILFLTILLTLSIAAPMVAWLSLPGSTLHFTSYASFLLPGFLLLVFLLLLPRIPKPMLNRLLCLGGVLVLFCFLVFQFSPLPILIYALGATGIFLIDPVKLGGKIR